MDIKATISYEDFTKIDLRVAKIKSAEFHPNADKLIVLQLDDGSEAGRQICAGIRGHYEPEELVGKSIVIAANLEPRKIRGEISNGMLCAASDLSAGEDNRRVILLTVDKPVAAGSCVS